MKTHLIPLALLAAFAANVRAATPLEILATNAPLQEKTDACIALARAGGPEAVPALAALLDDAQLAHMARYALEPMPDPAAGAALRDALARLQGPHLVGVIASVGARRDEQAVAPLTRLLSHTNVEVACAAARALGRIGTSSAGASLRDALGTASPAALPVVAEACLFAAEAQKSAELYDLVASSAAPEPMRRAAARGAILARGEAGIPRLIEQLRSGELGRFTLALGTAREMPGPALTKQLSAELATLPQDRRAAVVLLLGDRGDPAALPALLDATRGDGREVRVAAVRALAQIGDVSAVPVMMERLSNSDASVAAAAKAALAGLPEGPADIAIAALLDSDKPEMRSAAVALVGQRRTASAVPALLKAAGDSEAAVRTASLKVLADLAGPGEVPALIRILLATPSTAAEGTLLAACQAARPGESRIHVKKAAYGDLPNGRQADVTAKVNQLHAAGTKEIEASNANFGDPAGGVVKQLRVEYAVDGKPVVRTVRENEVMTFPPAGMSTQTVDLLCAALPVAATEPKLALLRVLRASGDPRGIAATRAAAADTDASVRDGARRILCDWPTAEVLPDVSELARTSTDAKVRILALRSVIRLVPDSDADTAQKTAQLGEALRLADRDDERLLVVSALGRLPSAESLALLEPLKGEPALKEAATVAAAGMAAQLPRASAR